MGSAGDWEELDDRRIGPQHWTLRTLPDRLSEHGDSWKGLSRCRRSLGLARRKLDALVQEVAS